MVEATKIGRQLTASPFRTIGSAVAAGLGAILPLSAGVVVGTHLPHVPAPLNVIWQFGVITSALTTAYFAGRNTRREFLAAADRPSASNRLPSDVAIPKG